MFKSITKAELLGALVDVPDDGVVAFSSIYGDRSRTEQVHELTGEVEERTLRKTAYSVSGYAVVTRDDDEDEDCFTNTASGTVWIIS